jgi:hypothetical protein
MQKPAHAKGVICFTNPEQLSFILQKGIYGNRSDAPPQSASQVAAARGTRFGKLKDLLCVAPGDYVFCISS